MRGRRCHGSPAAPTDDRNSSWGAEAGGARPRRRLAPQPVVLHKRLHRGDAPIGAAGRILLFPLLLAAVVTNHTFITLMEYALVVVILMFMLRRSRRYGRWIPAIPWFMAVPMIRRGRPPRPRGESVLSFRLTHPNGQTACHLGGHEGGIVPGDEVEVAGFRVGGILHAARVRNLTTGASYTRTRMISTGTVLACDALLLGITVNQVSGWWG